MHRWPKFACQTCHGSGAWRRIGAIGLLAPALACEAPTIPVTGQLGSSIALVSGDRATVPRVLVRATWKDCDAQPGGCTALCSSPPCPPDACIPAVFDSLAPYTALPRQSGTTSRLACVEVRTGAGLAALDPGLADPSMLAPAVTRLRFGDVPAIGLFDSAAPFLRVDHDAAPVAGVLGGTLLSRFAVEFEAADAPLDAASTIRFYRTFPGSEQVLAAQGRAFLRIQYPGRLLGLESTDRCEIEGAIGCENTGQWLQGNSWADPVAMMVDACLAPPPCTVTYDPNAAPGVRCALSSAPMSGTPGCFYNSNQLAGHNLSLLVGTAVPGLVLFSDSAQRIFGALDQLPDCDAANALVNSPPACQRRGSNVLPVPGWGTVQVVTRLRVRSLAVVAGLKNAAGLPPCIRLRDRLAGLREQCESFAQEQRPFRPSIDDLEVASSAERLFGHGAMVLGEVAAPLPPDDALRPDVWIDTSVIDRASLWATALRRLAGSDALQPDGVLGTALLTGTDTVLDTTESDEKPGVRARCHQPGSATCLSIPACGGDDEDRASCCHGLPQNLLEQAIGAGANAGITRQVELCCNALDSTIKDSLQTGQPASCLEN